MRSRYLLKRILRVLCPTPWVPGLPNCPITSSSLLRRCNPCSINTSYSGSGMSIVLATLTLAMSFGIKMVRLAKLICPTFNLSSSSPGRIKQKYCSRAARYNCGSSSRMAFKSRCMSSSRKGTAAQSSPTSGIRIFGIGFLTSAFLSIR